MSNYYTTQMMAFEQVDEIIKKTLSNGSSLNINITVLDMTRKFPVSPKAIQKRIELYVSANKESMEIVGDEVKLI